VAEAHYGWTRSRLTFNPIGHGRASDARTRDQGLTPKKLTVRFVEGPPRMGKTWEMLQGEAGNVPLIPISACYAESILTEGSENKECPGVRIRLWTLLLTESFR
jgi:hypothetical protein